MRRTRSETRSELFKVASGAVEARGVLGHCKFDGSEKGSQRATVHNCGRRSICTRFYRTRASNLSVVEHKIEVLPYRVKSCVVFYVRRARMCSFWTMFVCKFESADRMLFFVELDRLIADDSVAKCTKEPPNYLRTRRESQVELVCLQIRRV